MFSRNIIIYMKLYSHYTEKESVYLCICSNIISEDVSSFNEVSTLNVSYSYTAHNIEPI